MNPFWIKTVQGYFHKLITLGTALSLLVVAPYCSGQTLRDALIPTTRNSAGPPSSISQNQPSGISDGPISPGDIVHIDVFHAPDLNTVTRVSMTGDVAGPLVGLFHVGGLTSMEASERYAAYLKEHQFVLDPKVTITVESSASGISVLGEVHSPGIFPPAGKRLLSDVLAQAGGPTANTGRVLEISNYATPDQKEFVPWDPTMHNTSSYDRLVRPGDRILVRACGIAYVGGHVARPGAYSLCGSPRMYLSHLVSLAGGILPLSATGHTIIIRVSADGSRAIFDVDARKVLGAKSPDVEIHEDDVIYVPSSALKNATKEAMAFSMSLVAPLLYVYR